MNEARQALIASTKAKAEAQGLSFSTMQEIRSKKYPYYASVQSNEEDIVSLRGRFRGNEFYFLPGFRKPITKELEVLLDQLLTYWDETASIIGATTLYTARLDWRFPDEAAEMIFFKKHGYRFINQKTAYFLSKHSPFKRSSEGWIKGEIADGLDNYISEASQLEIIERLESSVSRLMLIIEQTTSENQTSEFIYSEKTKQLRYYHLGEIGRIKFDFWNRKIELKSEDILNQVSYQELSFEEAVQSIFKVIEKRNRLQNLFQPLRYHFNKMKPILTPLTSEGIEKIDKYLQNTYTIAQLEEVLATVENKVMEEKNVTLFCIAKNYFIVDENHQLVGLYHEHQKEMAIDFYEKMVFARISLSIRKSLQH
jgi:hypothetical protein